jgi:hypothetical protein
METRNRAHRRYAAGLDNKKWAVIDSLSGTKAYIYTIGLIIGRAAAVPKSGRRCS